MRSRAVLQPSDSYLDLGRAPLTWVVRPMLCMVLNILAQYPLHTFEAGAVSFFLTTFPFISVSFSYLVFHSIHLPYNNGNDAQIDEVMLSRQHFYYLFLLFI